MRRVPPPSRNKPQKEAVLSFSSVFSSSTFRSSQRRISADPPGAAESSRLIGAADWAGIPSLKGTGIDLCPPEIWMPSVCRGPGAIHGPKTALENGAMPPGCSKESASAARRTSGGYFSNRCASCIDACCLSPALALFSSRHKNSARSCGPAAAARLKYQSAL